MGVSRTAVGMRGVVDCFLTQREGVSWDKTVRSNGAELYVGGQELAYWHQDVVFVLPSRCVSSGSAELIRNMLRLGRLHNQMVVEWEVNDEYTDHPN